LYYLILNACSVVDVPGLKPSLFKRSGAERKIPALLAKHLATEIGEECTNCAHSAVRVYVQCNVKAAAYVATSSTHLLKHTAL
jgi:hypothetical protein